MATIDALRELVWSRTNGICELCGCPVDRTEMQMEHIVPIWQGGPDRLDNLRAVHRLCNMQRAESHRRGADHPNWKGGVSGVLAPMPPELRAELAEIAEREHRTLTNLMVHALREWLAGRGRPQQNGRDA